MRKIEGWNILESLKRFKEVGGKLDMKIKLLILKFIYF